jgi:hypothetical protein
VAIQQPRKDLRNHPYRATGSDADFGVAPQFQNSFSHSNFQTQYLAVTSNLETAYLCVEYEKLTQNYDRSSWIW